MFLNNASEKKLRSTHLLFEVYKINKNLVDRLLFVLWINEL